MDSDLSEFLVVSGLWYSCPVLKRPEHKALRYEVRTAYDGRRTLLSRSTKIIEKRLGRRLTLEHDYGTRFRTVGEFKADIERTKFMAIDDLGRMSFTHFNEVLRYYSLSPINFRPY